MKLLFYLLAAAAIAYGAAHYVPDGARHRALAAVGLEKFFQETLPGYLREKLSIPENPIARRKKLLEELSGAVSDIERELEAVVPVRSDGKPAVTPGLPKEKEIRERIGKSRELLARSETAIQKLKDVNVGESLFRKTAERVLDAVLPSPTGTKGAREECVLQ